MFPPLVNGSHLDVVPVPYLQYYAVHYSTPSVPELFDGKQKVVFASLPTVLGLNLSSIKHVLALFKRQYPSIQ